MKSNQLKLGNNGFTLVELLVVIAIIGILAGVVMASLSSIQRKSKDNNAIASMNQLRVGAEIDYNMTNSYTSICPTSSQGNGRYDTPGAGDSIANGPILKHIKEAQDGLTGKVAPISTDTLGSVTCSSSYSAFAVSIKLNTGYFCIDSRNFADRRVTAGLSGNACPSS